MKKTCKEEDELKEKRIFRKRIRVKPKQSYSNKKKKTFAPNKNKHLNQEQDEENFYSNNSSIIKTEKSSRQQYLINRYKRQENYKILGGGCGTSRPDLQNPKKIVSDIKKIKLYEKFIVDYNYYTDKIKITENIEQEVEAAMQAQIFKCLHEYRIFIRKNIQDYKPKLMELIDVYLIYVLAGSSRKEVLESKELKELGQQIKEMQESFDRESQFQPSLDLSFYFDMLYKFNSSRTGIDKQNENKLIEVSTFILKVVQLGASAFKGDFINVVKVAADLGGNLIDSYKKQKAKQLFSNVLDIYKKRVQIFKENIWKVSLVEELEFYIQLFCELSSTQEQETDYVLIILIKINYFFILAQEDVDFEMINQKLPLNSELMQKLLPKLIQQVDSKKLIEDTILQSFFIFSVKDPTFRFLAISILLKYNEIIRNSSDFQNYKENIIVYLIYKYLCEKQKPVKLAYETNKQFEIIYNDKIQDKDFLKKIQQISSKRRVDFQVIPELPKLENFEEKIDNQEDIYRMISNNLIERWERDVRKRKEEKIALKDDILLEVQDLYIQQSMTYLQGNKVFQEKLPSRQSFTQIDDDKTHPTSQLWNALQIIKDNFLTCDQQNNKSEIKNINENLNNVSQNQCKILGILAEGGTGKSMLLKKLETDLIENPNPEMSFSQNSNYIPLLIKCNSLDPIQPSIDKFLEVQGITQKQIENLKKSARNKVILLDGYDEYAGEYFRVYSKLDLKSWKNTKVIITSRREKLTLNEACINFSFDNESGQRDESSFCLTKLEEFNKSDILDYCKRYFKQKRSNNEQQIKNDLDCIKDCMQNQQLENLLYLPINLYLFTRMIVDIENQEEIKEIKSKIFDQIGIQEIFFKEQFKRETLDFIHTEKIGTKNKDQDKYALIINCYFEYFQTVAMQMFLNKGKDGIANFLQLQKDKIKFSLTRNVKEVLSEKQQKDLFEKITNYVNSQIITRVKEVDTNINNNQLKKTEEIEFKHKSLFEYFVARAMKYDFSFMEVEFAIFQQKSYHNSKQTKNQQ